MSTAGDRAPARFDAAVQARALLDRYQIDINGTPRPGDLDRYPANGVALPEADHHARSARLHSNETQAEILTILRAAEFGKSWDDCRRNVIAALKGIGFGIRAGVFP